MENVYVIQPIQGDNYKELHEEIISLIESAGAAYCGTIYQVIREVNPATFIGEGKAEALRQRLQDLDVTVVFNGELSPSQTLNLSAALDEKKVIDRTTLILDIFAQNAKTSEGKMQVELAQLSYLYPRLRGKGAALSRLGGGIGTRGPGETQLETDRRHIRRRIGYLREKMAETERRRSLQTERRKKNEVRTIALVGYTNTGKSTLLNAMTRSDVYVKDALFATLDPTARKLNIDGIDFLLIDTVGFLQELPHHLIEAFKSTLESALNADLALIVCDAKGNYEMQLKTTTETLDAMGFEGKKLLVMNKSEGIVDANGFPPESLFISAKEGLGLDTLRAAIRAAFSQDYADVTLFVPYAQLSAYAKKKKWIVERKIAYSEDGQIVQAVIPSVYLEQFRSYLR